MAFPVALDIRRKPRSPDGATTLTTRPLPLVIHRSTLRHRRGRIQELTDLDLDDVDSRLDLHVATRRVRRRGRGRRRMHSARGSRPSRRDPRAAAVRTTGDALAGPVAPCSAEQVSSSRRRAFRSCSRCHARSCGRPRSCSPKTGRYRGAVTGAAVSAPSTRRGMRRSFASRSAGGSTVSGTDW
ncbi:helix-turn-helix domain-containing protein [Amycolatopsis echigonensis]|uniref:Helix-turn-helix domain-containing protein n=1 Tax=Amycolatopsis echigonensis TaxID=2576905 RepID=A0A8E1W494_9PSEU|nr:MULTISPECIES: helix-turn-helix domain-containing protein [Amycolatopsis]MBB2503860.1 helix-turn-helix domain-containing protein [Amycolatopsis echigonensis]